MRRQWEKQMTAKRAKEWKTEPMALFQVELLQQHIFTATSNRITSTALISWIKPSEKKRKSHPSIKSTHFRLHCLMLKSFSTTLLLFLFVVFIIDSIHPIFCSHIWICKIKVGIECRSSSLLCKSNWIKRWNAKWKKKKKKNTRCTNHENWERISECGSSLGFLHSRYFSWFFTSTIHLKSTQVLSSEIMSVTESSAI